MEKIYDNIYRIEVPLPHSPLKALNSYMIIGDERNLLIDTGFNHPSSQKALSDAFEEAGISIEKTDIFITHAHVDHCGLSYKLKNQHNEVFCSKIEGDNIHSLLIESNHIKRQLAMSLLFGIPEGRILHFEDHPAKDYGPDAFVEFTFVSESSRMRVGKFNFEVVDLRGHSPGQIGLYERNHRLLFSGDHILQDISPNIVSWGDQLDSLQMFIDHLLIVQKMDVDLLFPAHRSVIKDHRKRISELLIHHDKRLKEVLNAVNNGKKRVYEVMGEITWEFKGGNTDNFPPEQLWFASSETHAHLENLRFKGLISRTIVDGAYHYWPSL
jgi:glyoxylase-like metal-dependent hydrolase (beta-lactamase superfamily II)